MAQTILAHDAMLTGTRQHHPAWTASFARTFAGTTNRPTLATTIRLLQRAPNDYMRGYLAGGMTLMSSLGDTAPLFMLDHIWQARAEFRVFCDFCELLDPAWFDRFELDDPDVRDIDEVVALASQAPVDYMMGYLMGKIHYRTAYIDGGHNHGH